MGVDSEGACGEAFALSDGARVCVDPWEILFCVCVCLHVHMYSPHLYVCPKKTIPPTVVMTGV